MAAVAHDESLAEDEILRRALELKKAVSDANTRPTMAHCRPLRLLWSHCEQTQRSLLGSGER